MREMVFFSPPFWKVFLRNKCGCWASPGKPGMPQFSPLPSTVVLGIFSEIITSSEQSV